MADNKTSWEEVKEHKSKNKGVWVVINNKVYDVTQFMDDHPGGEEVLLEQAGGDATEAFEDVGHSEDAKKLMKDFFVGDVSEPKQPPPKPEGATSLPNQDQGISYGLLFKLAIGILVLLLVYSTFISPYLKK